MGVNEGITATGSTGQELSRRGNSRSKGPEVRKGVACLRTKMQADMENLRNEVWQTNGEQTRPRLSEAR